MPMAEQPTPLARNLLRRALPESILRAIRVFRELDPASRAALPRVWFRRWFSREPDLPALPPSPRLLFVCRGNILRSAMAEAVFQQVARGGNGTARYAVTSAGTAAAEGNPADPRGQKVAQELGLDLSGHRARPLTAAAVEEADLILVMDYLNEAEVLGHFPSAAPKVRLLATFGANHSRPREIQDPYSGSEEDVRTAFDAISAAVRRLVATIGLVPSPPSSNSHTGAP